MGNDNEKIIYDHLYGRDRADRIFAAFLGVVYIFVLALLAGAVAGVFLWAAEAIR